MSAAVDRWAEMVVRGRGGGRHGPGAVDGQRGSHPGEIVVADLTDRRMRRALDVPWMMRPGADGGLVGLPSLPVTVLTVLGAAAALAAATSVSVAGDWAGVSDAVSATAVLTIGGSLVLLIVSTGVTVKASCVRVIGLFVSTTVPIELVIELRWRDGFTLTTGDGVEVGTMALAGSLLGALTGDRRQRNVVVRLVEWLARQPTRTEVTTASRTVIRWRYRAGLLCALWSCLCVCGVLLTAVVM